MPGEHVAGDVVLDEAAANEVAEHAAPHGAFHMPRVNYRTSHQIRSHADRLLPDEVPPLQSRIVAAGDDADLEEVYDTERLLLYVACTRAREDLTVMGVGTGSAFLKDLRA